jgi:acyl-coenzyme A synthetase/AMP-(fatty) acid ligase/thioesterase domain-containing protein/acyl carrier protein
MAEEEEPVLNRYTQPWLNGSNYALDWNGPVDRPFMPFVLSDHTVAERFARTAQAHPERIALDDGKTQLTYRDALDAVLALAAILAAETAPGELIGILLPASIEFPLAMLACFAAGRLFVPLDAHYPAAWLSDVMRESKMAAVVGRFDEVDVPEGVRKIDLAGTRHPEARIEGAPRRIDAPAVVLFTSGSTGKPKGIVNSERALLRRVEQYMNAAHIGETDAFLPLSSECTIAGLRERLAALLSGATLHLIDVQRAGARTILDRLSGVTMVYAVPALLRSLMQLGSGQAPSSLRVVRVGGEAVLWSDVEALRAWLPADCRIELGYSSTEAPIMQWFVPRDFPAEGSRVPLGYPLAGNDLAILGEDGEAVAAGEEGELVVRSPYIALGRWSNGALDTSDFPTDPNDPACRILRTGDLVRLRADGLIDLVGRKDRQLKIRGQRVEPGELEAALRREPGVNDAAVFPRRVGNQWCLIAYVSGDADPATLKAALKPKLPAPLQPQRLHILGAIPRLASAKLDMKALAALDEDWQRREVTALPVTSSEPTGPAEEIIAAIWRRVLGREDIGRGDDFFDFGGDSLMTLELMFAIEGVFGRSLPVTLIYDAPTIASLAAALASETAPSFSPLVKIKDGEGAPLFIVHGVGGNVMELFALGRRIPAPVYALQARGLDGREPPNRTIPAMAADYLAAIREAHPEGPVHLAGYSAGGLIAFEMARMLAAEDVPPSSLTLIDTQTNARQWPLSIWLRFLFRRGLSHLGTAWNLAPAAATRHLGAAALSFGRRILWRLTQAEPPTEPAPVRIPPALRTVYEATLSAAAAYKPVKYDNEINLILAETTDARMVPPETIWARYASRLTVRRSTGDHRAMVQGAHAARTAALLSDTLALATTGNCAGPATRAKTITAGAVS